MATDLATARAPSSAREPLWDNARGLAVVLVVVGHALRPTVDQAAGADWLYRLIYLFHVPLLVLVTGYLTAELTQRRAGRLVTTLVVPYVVFTLIQWAERWALSGHPPRLDVLTPWWTLWYLPAVVAWRLASPLLRVVRPWLLLAASVALSLLAGVGHGVGHVLAVDDVLTFLPFFVAGLLLREARPPTDRLPRGARTVAVAVFVCAGTLAWLTRDRLGTDTFQVDGPNLSWQTSDLVGSVLRLGLLLAGAVLVGAVLVLTPRRVGALTRIGRASLYVYLLHAPVLLALRRTTLFDRAAGTWWQTVVLVVAAAAFAALLASRPVVAGTRWLVEPPVERVLLRAAVVGSRDVAEPRPSAAPGASAAPGGAGAPHAGVTPREVDVPRQAVVIEPGADLRP